MIMLFPFFWLILRIFFSSRIMLRDLKRIKRLADAFRHSITINIILVTYFLNIINNDDTEYSTLLDNRELMQV